MINNIHYGSPVSADAASDPTKRTLYPATTGGSILGIAVSLHFKCIYIAV